MNSDCWNWPFAIGPDGYARMKVDGKMLAPHRIAFEMTHGEIPKGFHVDHTCRNTVCVNPGHLQAVPHRVNVGRGIGPTAVNVRKTHCIHGHEFTPENTYRRTVGGRSCRICVNEAQRAYQARRKAAA